MRTRIRPAARLYAARFESKKDALGCAVAGYQAQRHALVGALVPAKDTPEPLSSGLLRQEELTLLLPAGADIAWQDGIFLDMEGGEPAYTVTRLEQFPLHIRARLKRVSQ